MVPVLLTSKVLQWMVTVPVKRVPSALKRVS